MPKSFRVLLYWAVWLEVISLDIYQNSGEELNLKPKPKFSVHWQVSYGSVHSRGLTQLIDLIDQSIYIPTIQPVKFISLFF